MKRLSINVLHSSNTLFEVVEETEDICFYQTERKIEIYFDARALKFLFSGVV